MHCKIWDKQKGSCSRHCNVKKEPALAGSEFVKEDRHIPTSSPTGNTTSTSNRHQLVSSTTEKPRDTPSKKSTRSTREQHCPADPATPAVLRLPMQYSVSDKETFSKKNTMNTYRHKKQERFGLGPREDLPGLLNSIETPDPNQRQKTNQEVKFSEEQKHCNGYKKDPTTTSINTQHKPTKKEQVPQEGIEAIFKHEKPGPVPFKPSPHAPAVDGHVDQSKSEEKWRREAKKTIQDEEDVKSHQDQPSQVTAVEHQNTLSQEGSDNQQGPATSTSLTGLGFPRQRNCGSRKISIPIFILNNGNSSDDQSTRCKVSGKSEGSQDCQHLSQLKEREKFKLGTREDLPSQEESKLGPREDLPKFSNCQNYNGSWIKNSCSCYYITTEVEKTEADLQPIYSFLRAQQPDKAKKTSPLMDPATASVSYTHDAQKEAEQVLQKGTEAMFQVSQLLKHPTNSNLLHGTPDPQSLIPSLDTTEDEGRKIRVREMSNNSPINLENLGYLHFQLYSPNPVPAAYPNQDWDHGHLDPTKATSRQGLPDSQAPTCPGLGNAYKKTNHEYIDPQDGKPWDENDLFSPFTLAQSQTLQNLSDLPTKFEKPEETDQSQQPKKRLRMITITSDGRKSSNHTKLQQSKPTATHRSIPKPDKKQDEEEENTSGDPTCDEYHSMKGKEEDDDGGTKSASESLQINHLVGLSVHVKLEQTVLDSNRT